jgi:solute:Na+ symporter, SSS family
METMQHGFGWVDWLVLALYMAGMVAIGVAVSRRGEDEEGFFLGGRGMPTWAVTLSVLATSLSAATFIGVPQMAYGGNLTYLSLNVGTMIAVFLVAFVFLPPIYRAGTVTIYGYLGHRFGTPSMMAASAMFLVGRLLASGARLFMAGIGFALILYGETNLRELVMAIVLLGVIGTVYTAFGGIRAVIWTDAIQIVVVVFAAVLSIVVLLKAIPLSVGEIVTVLRTAPEGDKLKVWDFSLTLENPYTLWAALIASTFVSTSTFGMDHDLAQRMLTARSPGRGGAALIASTLLSIPVVLLFMVIGLLLFIYYGRPDLMGDAMPWDDATDTKRIYPQFLLNHLPPGLRGLSMAGLFAAAMSSFDSAINAMAACAVADVYHPIRKQRGLPRKEDASNLSRGAVVCMGIALTLFAILTVFMYEKGNKDEGLVGFALGVMAFALAPLLGIYSAAVFTRRGNNASVLCALAVGALAVLALQPYMLPAWCGFTLGWPWVWVAVAPLSFMICAAGTQRRGLENER